MASPTPLLQVSPSGIHGLGAFATQRLPANIMIGTYEGRRYTALQLSRIDWNDRLTYLFSLSNGETIDGSRGGNATRHINHSCAPNCQAVEERDTRNRLVLKIYTLEPVALGAEIFIDYGLIVDDSATPADYPCVCGALACRGTMVAGGPSNTAAERLSP